MLFAPLVVLSGFGRSVSGSLLVLRRLLAFPAVYAGIALVWLGKAFSCVLQQSCRWSISRPGFSPHVKYQMYFIVFQTNVRMAERYHKLNGGSRADVEVIRLCVDGDGPVCAALVLCVRWPRHVGPACENRHLLGWESLRICTIAKGELKSSSTLVSGGC